MFRPIARLLLTPLALFLLAFPSTAQPQNPAKRPTVAGARAFVAEANSRLLDLSIQQSRADWIQQNFITFDTERIAADFDRQLNAATTDFAARANRFRSLKLPSDVQRQLTLLRLSLPVPAPREPVAQKQLAEISAWLKSEYGKGRYCPASGEGKCLSLNDLEKILAESRDPKALLTAWTGWHSISPPMRPRYAEMIQLGNRGAREMGFADLGALWRSNYDMPPDAFAAEVDRLWQQVRPLYDSLHAYVRARLSQQYGEEVVPPRGPIPAHLLGNMWAQDWSNIYPLVAPPASDPGFDLTEILKSRKLDAPGMVRIGERFFTSLGFAPLPETFWQRSLFTKPADRDVVCHASAWSLDYKDDLRIKMCIKIDAEDFSVVHHELGHNFYQRAYNRLPYLFQNSANDGFHEAVGDAIALSVTPEYLKEIGFIQTVPPPSGDIGLLMQRALDKVSFLPFGLLVDQWRWKVFSGEVTPDTYNAAWWELRHKYQGVAPPMARTEADFDPGAKYHVPANVPYTRYFLAHIYQFQFHRALCRAAGFTGPLHRCSIYGNKAAGERLNGMLELGQSRPWPEGLAALSGETQLDATAILDYFAPLKAWLDAENARLGAKPGW